MNNRDKNRRGEAEKLQQQ